MDTQIFFLKPATRSFTELRNDMAEIAMGASQGAIFALTDHNRATGASIVPTELVDGDASQWAEDWLVARLFEVAPGRLANDRELAARGGPS